MEEALCPKTAAVATDITKKTRKNLCMLDLTRVKDVPEPIAIGCKTAAEGVLLL